MAIFTGVNAWDDLEKHLVKITAEQEMKRSIKKKRVARKLKKMQK